MRIPRSLARLTFLGAVCALCSLSGGCQSWSTLTVQSEGGSAIESRGTALSQAGDLTYAVWTIPMVGEPVDPQSQPKDRLTTFRANSFLVIIASEPIVLPKCYAETQVPCGELLVQLGRQTNARAWVVPPLPRDAVESPSSDSRAASELDLRSIVWSGYPTGYLPGGRLQFMKPVSDEKLPSTIEGIVERLDRFAVPIEGTLAIERSTKWTTRAQLVGCANGEPFQIVIEGRHGERFDPGKLARDVSLILLLPLLAISIALGGTPL